MAKKTVASLQKGEGRTYSKVIKMVKSPKTGAYTFQEQMVPNDAVEEALTCDSTTHTTYKSARPHRCALCVYYRTPCRRPCNEICETFYHLTSGWPEMVIGARSGLEKRDVVGATLPFSIVIMLPAGAAL